MRNRLVHQLRRPITPSSLPPAISMSRPLNRPISRPLLKIRAAWPNNTAPAWRSLIAGRVGANLDVAWFDECALKRTHRRVISQFSVAAEDDLLNLMAGGIELEAGKSTNVLTVLTNVGSKEPVPLGTSVLAAGEKTSIGRESGRIGADRALLSLEGRVGFLQRPEPKIFVIAYEKAGAWPITNLTDQFVGL